MSKKELIVWFDDKGNLLDKASKWSISYPGFKSESAKNFDDILEFSSIKDYDQGVSRVTLFSKNTNRKYSMFATDFSDVIKSRLFIDNQIKGTFQFIKKGRAQSIRLVLPVKVKEMLEALEAALDN